MKQQKATLTPAQKKAQRRWGRGSALQTRVRAGFPATHVIIGLTVIAYVLAMVPNLGVRQALFYHVALIDSDPWRLVTVSLTHGGFWHLGLNMVSLWLIGRILEPVMGSARFVALYVIATIGGDAAVSLLAPMTGVVGASGAIFGLMGALVIIARRLGSQINGLLIILAINFAYGVFVSGISWQAHLGGLIAGALVGLVVVSTRARSQRFVQIAGLVAVGVAATALAYAPYWLT